MSLEKMLSQAENKAKTKIGNLPWYARLAFPEEMTETKELIKKSKQLRKQNSNYQSSPEFYYQETELIAQSRDITIAAANRAYDSYEKLKPIPIIGKICEYLLISQFKGTLKKTPSREGLINLIDNQYKVVFSGGSLIAESNTNNNFKHYYQKANRPIKQKKYDTGLLENLTETVKKIYDFFTGEKKS